MDCMNIDGLWVLSNENNRRLVRFAAIEALRAPLIWEAPRDLKLFWAVAKEGSGEYSELGNG